LNRQNLKENDLSTFNGKHVSPKVRSSRKAWIVIVLIAVALHLTILILFKPHYLSIFKSELKPGKGESTFPGMERPFTYVPLEEQNHQAIRSSVRSQPEVKETERNILDEILNIPFSDKLLPRGNRSSSGKSGGENGGIPSVEPKPLYIPWPEYPRDLKKGISGNVELRVLVDEKGEVRDVKLIKGLPHKKLNDLAIRAAYNVKFSPGLVNGKPSKMWVKLTIGFRPG